VAPPGGRRRADGRGAGHPAGHPVHSLNPISGTWKNGKRSEYQVKLVAGQLSENDGNWRIAHHQVSVPLYVESGTALLNLNF
jgi:ribosomal protein L32